MYGGVSQSMRASKIPALGSQTISFCQDCRKTVTPELWYAYTIVLVCRSRNRGMPGDYVVVLPRQPSGSYLSTSSGVNNLWLKLSSLYTHNSDFAAEDIGQSGPGTQFLLQPKNTCSQS
jgi:hypothetical protein